LRKKLFAELNTDKVPVVFKTCLFKMNLTPGSAGSIEFHKALREQKDSEVFKSDSVKHIIDYKWQKLYYFGYGYFSYFCLYLIMVMIWQHPTVVLVWIILHAIEELIILWSLR